MAGKFIGTKEKRHYNFTHRPKNMKIEPVELNICAGSIATECDIRIDFDTNEYPNIFVSRKRYERISEYIRIKRNNTNMIRMNIRIENDTNIRIFKYSSHSNKV